MTLEIAWRVKSVMCATGCRHLHYNFKAVLLFFPTPHIDFCVVLWPSMLCFRRALNMKSRKNKIFQNIASSTKKDNFYLFYEKHYFKTKKGCYMNNEHVLKLPRGYEYKKSLCTTGAMNVCHYFKMFSFWNQSSL